jgi:SAM-dependent methyltransferase
VALKETYKIEREKWDAIVLEKAEKLGIHPLAPEDNFVEYSHHASTHIGLVDFFGDLQGQKVLEFGCGTGQMATRLAKSGADVTAFDLSPASVEIAQKRVAINGLIGHVQLVVSSGESLPFASESFDLIFGKAILHHMDAALGKTNLHRMLKPGGKAAFVEPMGMNPLLNFAREYIPYPDKNPRGADQPLNYSDIKAWGEPFQWFKYREIQLTSMLDRGFGFGKHLKFLTHLDDRLLGWFPFLRRFCRYVVIFMVK